MRLYQFLDPEGALAALSQSRLRISRIDRLNDPFEFLSADLSDHERRRQLARTKARLAKNRGLLCFSRTWRNPVLWGHYARKHEGLCLGFDVSPRNAGHVSYVSSRLAWPDKVDEAFVRSLLFTKFAHWSYEDEYRMFVSLEEEDGGHYYAKFSPELQLAEVLVGCRSTLTRAQVTKAITDGGGSLAPTRVRAAFRTFRMVVQKRRGAWA